MKIVINKCYGGFGLSTEAMLRLGELKGIKFYPEGGGLHTTFWTVPPNKRPEKDTPDYNDFYGAHTCYDRDLDRDDPDLVHVLEELGSEKASGDYASLRIIDIPDGVDWQIAEYDGNEWVEEKHHTWN